MLTHIGIRNFVIVDELQLEFSAGMSTLTGETGAGKSILIDALGLVLGDRADAGMVRAGADKAEISAGFTVSPVVREWLQKAELDSDDDELLLRRIVTAEGRSRAWVNGSSVPLAALRELAESLVEIHGQHAHQHLLKKDRQRTLLDAFLSELSPLQQVKTAAADWRKCKRELEALSGGVTDREQRLELLRYQLTELDELALTDERLSGLNQEYDELAHGEQILRAAQQGSELLDGEDDAAISSQLNHALQLITDALQYAPQLQPATEMIDQALISVQEATAVLRGIADSTELDPQRLSQLDQQLQSIHDLARKHRVEVEQLPSHHAGLLDELASLENNEAAVEKLQTAQQKSLDAYAKSAAKLSKLRQTAAKKLGKEITDGIAGLGMPHGRCEVAVTPLENDTPQAHGADHIEFLISANPGQPLQPLVKVASGGELARVSLAIQVAAAAAEQPGCMIFDEVDTGIGGAVAEMVGRKLRELGKQGQVMCVTHLATVAAQGHHQFQVQKSTDGKATTTRIKPLSAEERVDEIARMSGGVDITAATRAHAEELLRSVVN